MRICPLCTKTKPLCDSHIIPEFLYTSAYNEKNQIAKVERGLRRSRLLQKGIWEPLLCADCEHFLNHAYEQPMSKAWPTLFPDEISGTAYLLENVDYRIFKLFHLSILWRASMARRPEWADVSLGAHHEEVLRQAILASSAPHQTNYPLLGTIFVGPDTRRPASGWVGPHVIARLGQARVYSALYGGAMWHTVVASHQEIDPSNPFVLTERGQLGMPVYDIMQLPKVDLHPHLRFRWPTSQ